MTSALGGLTAALVLLAVLQWGTFHKMSAINSEHQLMGRWEWQSTAAPDAEAQTPANTGHRFVLEFDRRGRVLLYQDNAFVRAAAFSVRHEGSFIGLPKRQVLQYRGIDGAQLYSVSGNSLQLRDASGRALEHSYTRVRQ